MHVTWPGGGLLLLVCMWGFSMGERGGKRVGCDDPGMKIVGKIVGGLI